MSTLGRARGSFVVGRRILRERGVPFLDVERIAELRDRNVRRIVAHAAATVPHYRDVFREQGIDPREIRTADDLARLPLVTKAQVQADPERFRSESPATRDGMRYRTSGSTGMPLEVWHDPDSLLSHIAHAERERTVEAGLVGKRVRYRAVTFGHGNQTATDTTQAFYSRATFRPVRPGLSAMRMIGTLDATAAEWNELRPDVVRGYGSYLEALFRQVEAGRIRIHMPLLVVVAGDGITPEGRALIEGLGVPVMRRYAAVEAFKIAYTCEERGDYHLHDDISHLRELDGELVLSNLVNRATVLLNYRIGDLGRIGPPGCACGRTTRRLTALDGRASAVLRLPDGELVHSILVWGVLRDFPGVLRYQVVQRAPRDFELKLVTANGTFDGIAAEAVPRVSDLLGGAAVEATPHDELPPGPGGKFATVVPLSDPAP